MTYKISKRFQPKLDAYIEMCKSSDRIVDVVASEPSDTIIQQINGAFILKDKPVFFTFTVKNSDGVDITMFIVIPIELFDEPPPISEILIGADRFSIYQPQGVYFIRPDIKDSICLRGISLKPMSELSDNLKALLEGISKLDKVESAFAHSIIDPALLIESGHTNAISVEVSIVDITSARWPLETNHDVVSIILPIQVYEDVTQHDNIINTILDRITNLE